MLKKEMQLLLAAKENDITSIVKIFTKIDLAKKKGRLKRYVDINVKNSDGATALHYAAKNGNIELIEYLLARGAFIDPTDNEGLRPLSYACEYNHLNAVSKLIVAGSKLNVPEEENSPIHIAARMGHRDIVKILMDNGADIHSLNKLRQTPVDVACENNYYGVVNVLLSASSKLIEEFSETSFRNIARKSLNPSMMRTATLPAAISNVNISDKGFTSLTDDFTNMQEFKWYTAGSQEQISSPEPYRIRRFSSTPTKKSESLNAIFMQDEGTANIKSHNDSVERSLKSNILTNSTKCSPLEIVLPYPSKFSTSEVLKIKSPLLPLKNNQIKDSNYSYAKSPIDDSGNNIRQFNGLEAAQQRIITENGQSPRDNTVRGLKFRKSRSYEQGSEVSDKQIKSRSSLPSQSHNNIVPGSSPHYLSTNDRSKDRSVNAKPPAVRYREMRFSPTETNGRSKSYRGMDELANCPDNGNKILNNCTSADNAGISCHTWIKSISLQMIWDSLIKEGFDSFLALSLATDEELLILCNNRIDHLETLKSRLHSLSIPSIDQLMFSTDIQQILMQLGLEEYGSNFIGEGYFYLNHLPKVTEKLLNQLKIVKLGHRRLLFECLKSLIHNRRLPIKWNLGNRCSSSLSQEIIHDTPISPSSVVQTTGIKQKCNSLPRSSLFSNGNTKRSPPPIPPRSCSITDENCISNFTLNDILTESMCQENVSPRKKDYFASKERADELDCLDDIMNMLTNLGQELDTELNNKS